MNDKIKKSLIQESFELIINELKKEDTQKRLKHTLLNLHSLLCLNVFIHISF